MENNMENKPESVYTLPTAIIIAGIMITGAVLYKDGDGAVNARLTNTRAAQDTKQASLLEEAVLPSGGVVLPVTWGDLGAKLSSVGAIDPDKFKAIYEKREAFTDEYKNLLLGKNDDKLKITPENAGFLLNLFGGLGLASNNPVLDKGEMMNPKYGGAGNFASTGGWTIAKGNPMDHYSMHKFFDLTAEQQVLVEKISRGIYRPCCGNSTHFPDCNHGMAMLGFLELMASQGVSEQDMWKAALAINSYWFPDTYVTIATYMKNKSVEWKDVSPQEILGANYSSAQGYAKISAQVVKPQPLQSGGGCGVEGGEPLVPQPKQQSGCGV